MDCLWFNDLIECKFFYHSFMLLPESESKQNKLETVLIYVGGRVLIYVVNTVPENCCDIIGIIHFRKRLTYVRGKITIHGLFTMTSFTVFLAMTLCGSIQVCLEHYDSY